MGIKTQRLRIKATAALVLSLALVVVLSSCGPSRGAMQSDAATGYCPVCGMKVIASDPWAAEIIYTDRTKMMFESPGDMLAFYTSPTSYEVTGAHKDKSSIERMIVKDYQSKQATDARQAVFVYKSNIIGPMGADFVPFSKRADAEAFVAASGGTIVSLNEVTGDMARDLRK